MKRLDYTIEGWQDYKLVDSGNHRKLEYFGNVLLDRPEPQAIWQKKNSKKWLDADAQFVWADKGERWKISKNLKENWDIKWENLNIGMSFGGFKHVGIFPEHSNQWKEIQSLGAKYKNLKMLNLFGYTGVASMAAASVGIEVTHIDASKQTVQILKENLKKSHLEKAKIKLIIEDTLKYVKRLISRGEYFDIVIMDPPAFGRGPKGEIWKIEDSLIELLNLIPKILTKNHKMVLLNGYASGFSARTFAEIMSELFNKNKITFGEISIKEYDSTRVLTTGIYAKYLNE